MLISLFHFAVFCAVTVSLDYVAKGQQQQNLAPEPWSARIASNLFVLVLYCMPSRNDEMQRRVWYIFRTSCYSIG
jgi:hypothetical protein